MKGKEAVFKMVSKAKKIKAAHAAADAHKEADQVAEEEKKEHEVIHEEEEENVSPSVEHQHEDAPVSISELVEPVATEAVVPQTEEEQKNEAAPEESSDKPVVAKRGNYKVTLKKGETYYYCTCGRSKN